MPANKKAEEAEDVVMADAGKEDGKKKAADKAAEEEVEVVTHPKVRAYHRLREEVLALEAAVRQQDTVLVGRVVRYINTLRKHFSSDLLRRVVAEFVPASAPAGAFLARLLDGSPDPVEPEPTAEEAAREEEKEKEDATMQPALARVPSTADDPTDAEAIAAATDAPKKAEKRKVLGPLDYGPAPAPRAQALPEVEGFLQVLVAVHLFDRKAVAEALRCVTDLVQRVPAINRRMLDLVAARAYFYYALCCERLGRLRPELPFLLAAHRTACLHHDEPSQTVLTNAVLRLYIRDSLYAQADQFRLNTKMPDSAPPNQMARFLYYTGRINAVQLHYSDALENLAQALRKGPQKGAVGFRQQVQKLLCIVQLLMGDIPERSVFRDSELSRSLVPYFRLSHAVHVGNLAAFKEVMAEFHQQFVRDCNYTLIVRLRQTVIKTGLRKINLSYSRISLEDVREKLLLETVEAAEFVVAKAINDGVIDATIDHTAGVVYSKEITDVYSTRDPQNSFHRRVEFCLSVHNNAVRALRFPAQPKEAKEGEDEVVGFSAEEALDADDDFDDEED